LDGLVAAQLTGCLRLVKIDTEGSDLEVLKGGKSVLKSSDLKFIILEFGLNPDDGRHIHLNESVRFLADYHFFLAEVGGFGLYDGDLYGNALFLREGR
jgi:hypothetical protein